MLTPEYLDGIAEPLQAIYSELQSAIQQDLVRRIAKAGYATDSAAWQAYKLQELGASQEYIAQVIAETLNLSTKEVSSLFKEAGIKSLKTDIATQKAAIEIGLLPAHTIPLTASASVAQVLNANAIRTLGTLKKLTGTIAVDASGQLNKYMDQAQLMVQSGAFTEQMAIDATVRKFAADGVSCFDYASGVHTSIEAAVRRALVTGVNQATSEVSLNNAAELGTDLVEVTSHNDSRPEHAAWQGKVYKLTGNNEKYRNLAEATGYGTGAGLCGWNCRHSFYAYIEGVSDKLPREKYDPKTYEAEQVQRYNERQIRHWKRRAATLEAGGLDNSKELLKVRTWQLKQAQHLQKTGLTRLGNREQVLGFNRSMAQRAVWAEKKKTLIDAGAFTESSISQKTVQEAQNWANKTLGVPSVDYTGQSVGVANEVNRTLKKIFSEYPVLNGFIDRVEFKNMPSVAQASLSHRNGKITASLSFSSSKLNNLKAIDKMIADEVGMQFWSPKDGLYGITKHECAHLLEYAHTLKKYGATKVGASPASITTAFTALRSREVSSEVQKRALAACNLADDASIIKNKLSDYANTNSSEFLAEAVSEHNPRKLAKITVDIFKNMLGVK